MPLTFYPHLEDSQRGMLEERIDVLMEAAERYRAVVLDESSKAVVNDPAKRMVPREQRAAYNWEEIAHVLREIRGLPEGNKLDKLKKGDLLGKLAEVYDVLRAAKMSKLEAVKLALISESNQLRGGAAQVA
jgi:hypothetical protein